MANLNSRIIYIWDEELIKQCDRIPAVVGRASLVHSLISVYGLLDQVQVVHSTPATYKDLKNFHSELYLDHLKKLTDIDDEYIPDSQDEEYGIVYDCPPISNMYQLVSTIAGGSITAAKCLLLGMADVSINWCGGWHHAQSCDMQYKTGVTVTTSHISKKSDLVLRSIRFGAEGFCYVNDIVLAIEMLRRKFPKILYIDLDVHHGNGVQDAYNLSKSVFTLSFHKHEPGFYPGTGSIDDIGTLTGKGYSCNVPLKAGYTDQTLEYVFEKIFPLIYSSFMPDAIVMQCGADALAHDPHGGAGLTSHSYCTCVKQVLDKRKPLMLLGGGGYKHTNAARLWTTLLGLVTGVELDQNVPEHDQWPNYGPGFLLTIEPTLAKDTNTQDYLDKCIATVEANLKYCCNSAESQEDYNKKQLAKRQKTNITDLLLCSTNITKTQGNENNRGGQNTSLKNLRQSEKRIPTFSLKEDKAQLNDAKDVYDFDG